MTGGTTHCIASHLIPKRLGDRNIREIIDIYAKDDSIDTEQITRYDSIVGVLLTSGLDEAVDKFELGFWHRVVSDLVSVVTILS